MTRFEELCEAYARSSQEYLNCKHSCQDFADFLVHRFSLYLECPMKTEEMRFDEDASLYVRTSLVLYANPQDATHSPTETIGINLCVSKKGNDFEITFLGFDNDFDGKIFRVPEDDLNRLDELYEAIFNRIKSNYERESAVWRGETQSSPFDSDIPF